MTKSKIKILSKFQTKKGVKKKILRTFLILEVFFFVSKSKRGEAHPGLNGALFFLSKGRESGNVKKKKREWRTD